MWATDEFVLAHRQLRSDPRASDHEVKNVQNWLYNNNGPIHEKEACFIEADGDLVSLVPKVHTPLRRWLEKYDWFRLFGFFRIPTVSQPCLCLSVMKLTSTRVKRITISQKIQGIIVTPSWTHSHLRDCVNWVNDDHRTSLGAEVVVI